MSGNDQPVLLAGTQMGALVRAARIAGERLPRFAIIGGVAVVARLGRAHRATADLDAVVDDDRNPSAIEVLRDLPEAEPDPNTPNRFYVEGTRVEIIGTNAIADSELRALDEIDVLFAGGHRWALETATNLDLMAVDGDEQATVPVATAGALVAMKLHAIQRRSDSGGVNKRAGDAADLILMLANLDRDGSVADAYTSASPALLVAVRSSVQRILIDGAPRIKRWLNTGAESTRAITIDEIVYLGTAFAERVERFSVRSKQ